MVLLEDALYLEADLLVRLDSAVEFAGHHRDFCRVALAHKLLIGLDRAKNSIRVGVLRILDRKPRAGVDARVAPDDRGLDAALCANVVVPIDAEHENLAVHRFL